VRGVREHAARTILQRSSYRSWSEGSERPTKWVRLFETYAIAIFSPQNLGKLQGTRPKGYFTRGPHFFPHNPPQRLLKLWSLPFHMPPQRFVDRRLVAIAPPEASASLESGPPDLHVPSLKFAENNRRSFDSVCAKNAQTPLRMTMLVRCELQTQDIIPFSLPGTPRTIIECCINNAIH